jgi:hypothetical protein
MANLVTACNIQLQGGEPNFLHIKVKKLKTDSLTVRKNARQWLLMKSLPKKKGKTFVLLQ